jgi:hypothetical protein
MENIDEIHKSLTQNMQKLLDANEQVLNLLSEHDPELAHRLIRDVSETMKAVKTNDINRINKILERYADNDTN